VPEGGESLKQAYEQAVVGMFGYMTDLDTVDVEDQCEVEVEGTLRPSPPSLERATAVPQCRSAAPVAPCCRRTHSLHAACWSARP
jgi:hypothetical protein